MHYYAENYFGDRLSLIGTTITLFDHTGKKLCHWFYKTKEEAKKSFFAMVD